MRGERWVAYSLLISYFSPPNPLDIRIPDRYAEGAWPGFVFIPDTAHRQSPWLRKVFQPLSSHSSS